MKKICATFIVTVLFVVGVCPILSAQASAFDVHIKCGPQDSIFDNSDESKDMGMSCCDQNENNNNFLLNIQNKQKKENTENKTNIYFPKETINMAININCKSKIQNYKPKIIERSINHMVWLE